MKMAKDSSISKNNSILIVGAGVFGLSTALELKSRGYRDVTVVDRYLPPVPDGSSVDISRVIRTDYADPIYAQMAREAHEGWTTEYKDCYYNSGFIMLSETKSNKYADAAQEVNRVQGKPLDEYDNANDLKAVYPGLSADLSGLKAYHNPNGGWADAEASIRHLSCLCTSAGVSFITGRRGTVLSLRRVGSRVIGVNVAQGDYILASQVILSTGAWSNRLLDLSHAASASGQPVGFIQLTPEEAKKLEKTPVMINMTTGVFCFPPTPGTHILKIARHGYGYATDVQVNEDGSGRKVSSPKRDSSNISQSFIPEDAENTLRHGLQQLSPTFVKHPWLSTRLCWYTDTPEGDFVIDNHPTLDGLFVATGGAGHAFKFLPVLGRYITDCFENKASPALRKKWQLRSPQGGSAMVKIGDGSRGGPPLRKLSAQEHSKL